MFSLASTHLRLEQPFYVLVATDKQDDQFLITQSLRGSKPRVQLTYSLTAEQTHQHLLDQAKEYYCFPRLLIIDLGLAEPEVVWQLVSQIRLTFPALPVVLISSDHRTETVQQAYTSGVNAFVMKQPDRDRWQKQLVSLATYWLTVVTLPTPSTF